VDSTASRMATGSGANTVLNPYKDGRSANPVVASFLLENWMSEQLRERLVEAADGSALLDVRCLVAPQGG
jgi:hypothetical protein